MASDAQPKICLGVAVDHRIIRRERDAKMIIHEANQANTACGADTRATKQAASPKMPSGAYRINWFAENVTAKVIGPCLGNFT